jgi:hypothetical protein
LRDAKTVVSWLCGITALEKTMNLKQILIHAAIILAVVYVAQHVAAIKSLVFTS